MMEQTSTNSPIDIKCLVGYFDNLVNQFFKILPMRENGEDSVFIFMRSLQVELIGYCNLVTSFKKNHYYLTLLSILEYLIDTPDCAIEDVKREVFKAINICKHISSDLSTDKLEG